MTAPADAGALLSTLAGAGATLVAIVGGLLVSRYVSLDSELAGAHRRLDEVEARQTDAQKSLTEAQRAYDLDRVEAALYDEDAWEAILKWVESTPPDVTANGAADLIQEIGYAVDLSHLKPELVEKHLDVLILSARKVRRLLEGAPESVAPQVRRRIQIPEWDDLSKTLGIHGDIPQLWHYYYESRTVPRIAEIAVGNMGPDGVLNFEPHTNLHRRGLRALIRPGAIGIPERLQRLLDEARRDADALAAERNLAQLAVDAIGRPRGLVLGLTILGALTLLQIVPPVLFLAFGAGDLGTGATWLVLSLFFIGMLALLGYLVSYARRLGLLKREPDLSSPS